MITLRDAMVGGGAAFLGGLTTWWFLTPIQAATVTQRTEAVSSHMSQVPRPPVPFTGSPPDRTEVVQPIEAASSRESALRLVAELSGQGVLRCDIPDSLPPGSVVGVHHGWVEDGVLTAAVSQFEGNARIHLPGDAPSDPPRVVVRWWDAWPGERGRCQVVPPTPVDVAGIALLSDGSPAAAGQAGNLVDGVHPVSSDGSFHVTCWLGATCPVAGRADRTSPWGPFVSVVPDGGPPPELVVWLDAPTASEDTIAILERQVAEHIRLEGQPDPLRLALDEGILDSDARDLVEGWLEDQTIARRGVAEALTSLRQDPAW